MGVPRRANRVAVAAALLLSAAFAPAPLHAQVPDINAEAGVTFDDNVNRARNPADRLSDRSYSLRLSTSRFFQVTANSRVSLQGFAGAERFSTYAGLSRTYIGAQAEFQYRASGEFLTPTYAVFGRTTAENHDSNLRDGYRHSVGVTVRKPVTDRIHLFGSLAHNIRDGKSTVFDTRETSARLNFDYSLTRSGTVYLGGEYRRGDVVSTVPPSLAAIGIAEASIRDDVFAGSFSYRIKATTFMSTLGYNLAVHERGALDFSWTRVQSTPLRSPGFAIQGPSRYVVNQIGAAYLHRF